MLYGRLISNSYQELKNEADKLQRQLSAVEKEMERRDPNNETCQWGYNTPEGIVVYSTFSEAVKRAVEHFKDPDAGYYVFRAYSLIFKIYDNV
ncbi:MAG: hypothetical protein WD512_19560 [Candidatus Paceibacterota bacterium]